MGKLTMFLYYVLHGKNLVFLFPLINRLKPIPQLLEKKEDILIKNVFNNS